jgi:hypothetical protein
VEASHSGCLTMTETALQPHQQRVVAERATVSDNACRLAEFMRTDTYASLDLEEKRRLRRQLAIMAAYTEVLEERISAFFCPGRDVTPAELEQLGAVGY